MAVSAFAMSLVDLVMAALTLSPIAPELVPMAWKTPEAESIACITI